MFKEDIKQYSLRASKKTCNSFFFPRTCHSRFKFIEYIVLAFGSLNRFIMKIHSKVNLMIIYLLLQISVFFFVLIRSNYDYSCSERYVRRRGLEPSESDFYYHHGQVWSLYLFKYDQYAPSNWRFFFSKCVRYEWI